MMKKHFSAICCLLLIMTMMVSQAQTHFNNDDRLRVIKDLQNSENMLMSEVSGLSEAQLNYKPGPDQWSIANCVEHLAISEGHFMDHINKSIESQADASRRSEIKHSDDEILGMIMNRDTKIKTSESLTPSNSFGTYDASLAVFKGRRDKTLDFIQSTTKDLRNHYLDYPFGTVDVVQGLLFASGHTTRHIDQIKEIKASPGFPK